MNEDACLNERCGPVSMKPVSESFLLQVPLPRSGIQPNNPFFQMLSSWL
jgi:hypothetical protein